MAFAAARSPAVEQGRSAASRPKGHQGRVSRPARFITGQDRLILEHGRDCHTVLADEQNVYIDLGDCDIVIIDRAALHAVAGRTGPTPPVVKAKVKKPASRHQKGRPNRAGNSPRPQPPNAEATVQPLTRRFEAMPLCAASY